MFYLFQGVSSSAQITKFGIRMETRQLLTNHPRICLPRFKTFHTGELPAKIKQTKKVVQHGADRAGGRGVV